MLRAANADVEAHSSRDTASLRTNIVPPDWHYGTPSGRINVDADLRQLSLERVRQLHEHLPIGLVQIGILRRRHLAQIAGADEKHRLPVQFVGEEDL